MPDFEIRRARPAEGEILSRVAWASKRHWGYADAWMARWRAALRITPGYLNANPVFVAARGRRVVAFYALLDKEPHWELDHLWVHPRFIGNGIGRALFVHAATYVRRRAAGATLRIESEPKAEGFYTRMGARRVGTIVRSWQGLRREIPCLELAIEGPARSVYAVGEVAGRPGVRSARESSRARPSSVHTGSKGSRVSKYHPRADDLRTSREWVRWQFGSKGRYRTALRQAERSLAAIQEYDHSFLMVKAKLLSCLGRWRDLAILLQDLARRFPRDPEVWNEVARFLAAHGDWDSCRGALGKNRLYLRSARDWGVLDDYHYVKLTCLHALGEKQRAIREGRRAVKRLPRSSHAKVLLTLIERDQLKVDPWAPRKAAYLKNLRGLIR